MQRGSRYRRRAEVARSGTWPYLENQLAAEREKAMLLERDPRFRPGFATRAQMVVATFWVAVSQLGLGRNPTANITGPSTPAVIAVSGGEEQDADHASPRGTTASASDGAASQPKRTRQRQTRSRSAPPQSESLATPTAEA